MITSPKPVALRRVCFVSTAAFTVKWYLGSHIRKQRDIFDLTVMANGSIEELGGIINESVHFAPLAIKRKISIIQDLITFYKLWRFFRVEKFDLVHSIMPKAGLLSMLAAYLAGTPYRLHTFTGQIWLNKTGVKKFIFKWMDKLIVLCSTRVLADSPTQREFMISQKIAKPSKIDVLCSGSVGGVDIPRFQRNQTVRAQLRAQYGLNDEDIAFLFVGRISLEKGVRDLMLAFEAATKLSPKIHLIIVGPDEGGLQAELLTFSEKHFGRVHLHGFTNEPEIFMSCADVVCLPSYREGFGGVILEAAAAGLPSIASRIYGITDAVDEGVTGMLCEVGAVNEIKDAMLLMARNLSLRQMMGSAARKRTVEKFSEELVAEALIDYYFVMSQNL